MGAIASRYSKHDDDGSSKEHRIADRRSSSATSSIIRRRGSSVGSNSKMKSFSRSKSSPAGKDGASHQATLVPGGDVGKQSKSKARMPLEKLENISNDEMVEEKSTRGRKTVLNQIRGGASKAFITSPKEDEIVEADAAPKQQPIDPPGSHWNHSGGLYGGNHPASLQPVGFPMPMWAPPHLEGEDANRGRSWAVPPFLAPIAATVRLSHFVPNGQGYFHYWQEQQQQQQGGNNDEEFVMPMSMDSEAMNLAAADSNVTMKEDDIASLEVDPLNVVGGAEFPSTFAPQECIDKIRAKANIGKVNVIQTRSMTAKNSRSSKSKVTPIAAHQASSPLSTKDKGRTPLKMVEGEDTPVEVMTVLGKTVHMIDADRKVFVIDLLSPETCDEIRLMADNHTRNAKKDAEVWRTLYTYTKMDLPVVEVKDMVSKYTDNILYDVKKIVGVVFGKRREAMRLRPRSWKEPHLLLYQALDGKPYHTGIEMHYDGCDVTWQAMLTRQDEYEGGGTYFRSLRKTIRLKQGQVLVHPGELYHKGIDITYGVRCLLVCFTDGMDPKILDDSKQEDDDPKYETDILVC